MNKIKELADSAHVWWYKAKLGLILEGWRNNYQNILDMHRTGWYNLEEFQRVYDEDREHYAAEIRAAIVKLTRRLSNSYPLSTAILVDDIARLDQTAIQVRTGRILKE